MPPKTPAPRLTHFLCLPLVTPSSRPQLQASLSVFREKITQNRTPRNPDGIPEAAVRPLGTLHLTLGVMSLVAPEKVERALGLLRELDLKSFLLSSNIAGSSMKEEVTSLTTEEKTVTVEASAISPSGSVAQQSAVTLTTEERETKLTAEGRKLDTHGAGPMLGLKPAEGTEEGGVLITHPALTASSSSNLTITLKGLQSMHPNPGKTSILYAPPTPNRVLQAFCLKLRDAFLSAELLVPDTRPLLLHATILNTVYVPGVRGKGKGSGHGKSRARLTIDATEILEDWEDFEWMKDVRVEKVAICRMGAKKLDDGSEEYVVEGSVDIP
ncbi:uncharacterized protein BP5553_03341 [Venustampulla echinocandica]|uniref:A-kinase anchor protein 7-like phosphoesterase domain-containing protein n=1 Tax=Venustampulla echinocandica TaxID=2656787 RepID=A0A370TTZ4_9HELO|nr:uncharacterized protein BP5553_03341 [Venustampulla echinocandica]RDL39001.1 hypothetical protein BP5553_03341 [Venustampulla echinocandica]